MLPLLLICQWNLFDMEIIFQPKDALLVYKIDGIIAFEDIKRLQNIQASIPKGNKIRILALVEKFDGYKNIAIAREALVLDLAWIGKAEKYAMVADSNFLRSAVKIFGLLVPKIKFKAFRKEGQDAAYKWLGVRGKKE